MTPQEYHQFMKHERHRIIESKFSCIAGVNCTSTSSITEEMNNVKILFVCQIRCFNIFITQITVKLLLFGGKPNQHIICIIVKPYKAYFLLSLELFGFTLLVYPRIHKSMSKMEGQQISVSESPGEGLDVAF